MTIRKAFVLLSGGLDSTTCLYKAIWDYTPDYFLPVGSAIDWVEAVSIDYGQRHKKEMEYAKATCDRLGIAHFTIPLGDALRSANTMLTEGNIAIPQVSYADLPHGVSPTYVPFRNGTMLSLLAAHAQKWVTTNTKKEYSDVAEGHPQAGLYFGAHAEDAHNWAYPDCTPEFIGSMANAIYVGTYHAVRLHTPLMWLMKHEIVKLGAELGVPFQDTWSCYAGGDLHCGTCPTCRSRHDAFTRAGIDDPTRYAA